MIITIEHSYFEGTNIHCARRDTLARDILTEHVCIGHPRGLWSLAASRDFLPDAVRISGLQMHLEAAGYTVRLLLDYAVPGIAERQAETLARNARGTRPSPARQRLLDSLARDSADPDLLSIVRKFGRSSPARREVAAVYVTDQRGLAASRRRAELLATACDTLAEHRDAERDTAIRRQYRVTHKVLSSIASHWAERAERLAAVVGPAPTGPGEVTVGDYVQAAGRWWEVIDVSPKTVVVPWRLAAPTEARSWSIAQQIELRGPHAQTDRLSYLQLTARCSAADIETVTS